eukprot:TRINITY_DN24534_c0_g5_i1.p1 TRINITY_DN24534_c0_g5~~TRINITY_DN24534_c0_g5_i1.p1  ORF type:complete len:1060 (-),score=203.22 TRINITY_DN24534_c0_g5_i1:130-3252(-)
MEVFLAQHEQLMSKQAKVSAGAVAARVVPVLFVPLLVAILQPHPVREGLPSIVLALACGSLITAATSRLLLSVPLATLMAGLLLSVQHVQELQAAERSWDRQHLVVQAPKVANERVVTSGRTTHPTPAFSPAPAPLSHGAPAVPAHDDDVQTPPTPSHTPKHRAVPAGSDGAKAVVPAAPAKSETHASDGKSKATHVVSANDGKNKHGGGHLRGHESVITPRVKLETFSIVLPCAMEGNYAQKTVEAIWKNSNKSRIAQIIVVDDGSTPELKGTFPDEIKNGKKGAPPVNFLRHEKTEGLISAKKSGGDAATGDVIVFFDCHVSPREGWDEAFLKQMRRAGDHRTVVVPTITSLNPDTWEEINKGHGGGVACYFGWNADFTWLHVHTDKYDKRDVPLMSGGLLAISRKWWEETGGYDRRMVAWGGENIDQSLRIWLCGGRIEVAEGAYVAHMWRDPKNPKTRLHYPIPTKDVMRNKARAVSAWFDDFKHKTFGDFPEYAQFVTGKSSIGDMSDFTTLKSRLTCAPFTSYLTRFSHIYLDAGFIPEQVYQLREKKSGRCLQRVGKEKAPFAVVLAPCDTEASLLKERDVRRVGQVAELQLWHPSNRDKDGSCCSGMSNWNYNQCLDSPASTRTLQTTECEIMGSNNAQSLRLSDGQLKFGDGKACVTVVPPSSGGSKYLAVDAKAATKTGANPLCGAVVEAVGSEQIAGQGGQQVPKKFRLVNRNWHSAPDGLCAYSSGIPPEEGTPGYLLHFQPCIEGDSEQIFTVRKLLDGFEVSIGGENYCLDYAGGSKHGPYVYPCYSHDNANANQVWRFAAGSNLLWQGGDVCVGGPEEPKEKAKDQGYRLETCSAKNGQLFNVEAAGADGSKAVFRLVDAASKRCLGAAASVPNKLEVSLQLEDCGAASLWKELKDTEQVQHVSSNLCLDGGDHEKPILYPCHAPKAAPTQRWKVMEKPGWVLQKGSWGDNGRKRYFERCLDSMPSPPLPAGLRDCKDVAAAGVEWERIGAFVPRERKFWEEAKKPSPHDRPLGWNEVDAKKKVS